jgi:hypothetical protein
MLNNNRDDIPLLSATTTDTNKYALSTLNPDASSFTFGFSPANHYQQTRINHQKNGNHENACSTSDYYSQSGLPSSGSSSVRSAASLSPSILSAISPSMLLPFDSPTDDNIEQCTTHRASQTSSTDDKRSSTCSSLNVFIGDKILNLYGSKSTVTSHVDTNNNQTCVINFNLSNTNSTCAKFDSK